MWVGEGRYKPESVSFNMGSTAIILQFVIIYSTHV